jgi:FtsH-binding integral membrane protein
MGGSLASGFMAAAQRNLPQANAGIASYLATRFNYVRQVDVHSHWAGLAILLIVFGALFDRVAFDERKRVYLALAFLVGSVVFPLGVILQTLTRGPVASALAVSGAALVIIALAGIAVGLARSGEQA